ncbi:MAG TPA: energy-coupling factor ABC transporter permease [Planctomycetaceae bacterium]|jgi:cobalt/nickel transport system permease protein|nr:energy-coupling factor ABC transporter permease [Planctomycetaceae bacterium]
MHIQDGYLSPEVCAATGAVAAVAVGYSIYKLRDGISDRVVPLTGMTAAMIFAGQMVNFPIGLPVSGHLIGGVLAGMLLGPWAGCLAITMVLVVQRFLFSDGGLFTLGANILHMAVIGAIGGYAIVTIVRRFFRKPKVGAIVGSVVASWLTVVAASALFCVEFRLSHPAGSFEFRNIFALMVAIHSLIGVGEALITAAIVSYVLAQRPDLIFGPTSQSSDTVMAGVGRITAAGIVVALCVGAFLAPFKSNLDDGLEHVSKVKGFSELAHSAWALFADYDAIPILGGHWQGLSVSVAGVVGTLSVFLLALAFGRAVSPRSKAVEAGRE